MAPPPTAVNLDAAADAGADGSFDDDATRRAEPPASRSREPRRGRGPWNPGE